MSIVGNAIALHSRLLSLPRRAGLSQYQHTVRVIKNYVPEGSFLPVETAIEVDPNPKVQPVPLRLAGSFLSSDVVISEKDLMITDIVMSYSEDDLQGDWEIDGLRGYRLLSLTPLTTTYRAIVRAPFDKGYPGNFPE